VEEPFPAGARWPFAHRSAEPQQNRRRPCTRGHRRAPAPGRLLRRGKAKLTRRLLALGPALCSSAPTPARPWQLVPGSVQVALGTTNATPPEFSSQTCVLCACRRPGESRGSRRQPGSTAAPRARAARAPPRQRPPRRWAGLSQPWRSASYGCAVPCSLQQQAAIKY